MYVGEAVDERNQRHADHPEPARAEHLRDGLELAELLGTMLHRLWQPRAPR
jgi:hypothetical protein